MKRILTYVYLPLAALYVFMSVVYPTDPAAIALHNLSMLEARAAALSVALPLIVIWLFAFYGSWRLKAYARRIRGSRDGTAFMGMAIGMQILALYLPVRAVAKILLNYLAYLQPSVTTVTNLLITYLSLIIPLVAYLFISHAARKLVELVHAKASERTVYVAVAAFILTVIGFTFRDATEAATKLTPSNWLIFTDYSLATPIRVVTVILPYLFMWFIGLIAVYEIYVYQKLVHGVLYRESLRLLSVGLAVEILVSISIQYITAFAGSLQKLPLGIILVIVYSMLTLIAAAFVMIAQGVRKLERLEDV